MPNYHIHPLMIGTVRTSKGVATYMVDTMQEYIAPVFAFYIEGGERKILVDTGISAPGLISGTQGYRTIDYGRQGLINGLAGIGLHPEDIDIVVITHMHIDHGANFDLFPQAEIILQRREWEYTQNPLPIHQGVYLTGMLPQLAQQKLRLIDGDFELMPGVRAFLVPGHTDGQQAVAVDTPAGTYVIAGDLISVKHNIYPELDVMVDAYGHLVSCTPLLGHSVYPPGIHTNLIAWYESVERVLTIAGNREHVLPSHDPDLNGKVFPEF